MSLTSVILPLLSVLSVAQDTKLGHSHSWRSVNEQQQILLDRYLPKTHELKSLLPEELRSCASDDRAVVNKFLKDNGFTIQLEEGNEGLAVASILDIALTWKEVGKKATLSVDDTDYPAVSMKTGYTIQRATEGHEIIIIDCENGDTVHMTLADKPQRGFDLLDTVKRVTSLDAKDVTEEYSGAVFPMVELNQQEDISWLIGLWYDCPLEWEIDQALQQTKFSMNEKGAHAQSAVAVHLTYRSMPIKRSFVIDKPFYLWIERPCMSVPLFTAYFDRADWKEPVGLN